MERVLSVRYGDRDEAAEYEWVYCIFGKGIFSIDGQEIF